MKGREYGSNMEIDPVLLRGYADAFIPRFDRYPLQLPDGKYVAIKHPLTLDLVANHLRGSVTIGAYALNEKSRARWICLDADEESEWQGLLTLSSSLAERRVPAYLEPSRRGGHLWLFFPPMSGADARRFG